MKRKIILMVTILLIIVSIIIYNTNKKVVLTINNIDYEFKKGVTSEEINLKQFSSENDIVINTNGNKIKINDDIVNETIILQKMEINKNNKIEIQVKHGFKYVTYYINTLPSDFPNYTVEGKSNYEGDYYLTTYYIQNVPYYILKLDEEGKLIFYKKTEKLSFDFHKQIIDDKIRYTYLEVNHDNPPAGNAKYAETKLVVLDENYNEIDRISFYDEEEQNLENHDYIFIDDNHYIIPSNIETIAPNVLNLETSRIVNSKIQEVKDGEVLWTFSSMEYPEFYEYVSAYEQINFSSKEGSYADYMHFNSMTIDPSDNNLIVSYKTINAIIKINRTNGELMWILGGIGDQFGLTEKQLFSGQHSISFLSDGSILIFDNGTIKEKTRLIKIKLDEVNKKVISFADYVFEDVYSSAMGSVQVVDEEKGIYLVCYGMSGSSKSIEEININTNEVYFSMRFDANPMLYNVNKK